MRRHLSDKSSLPANSRLWSDFDGTAVGLAPLLSLRNALKYSLPLMPGYLDFLKGVKAGGIEVAGIVTARPDIRRLATNRSIARLGLGEFFNPANVIYARSQVGKGKFLAEQSLAGRVAMIEDMPHKLGPVLVGAMHNSMDGRTHQPITLGVVETKRSARSVAELIDRIDDMYLDTRISERTDGGEVLVEGQTYSLRVVQLPTYSELAGRKFAKAVNS